MFSPCGADPPVCAGPPGPAARSKNNCWPLHETPAVVRPCLASAPLRPRLAVEVWMGIGRFHVPCGQSTSQPASSPAAIAPPRAAWRQRTGRFRPPCPGTPRRSEGALRTVPPLRRKASPSSIARTPLRRSGNRIPLPSPASIVNQPLLCCKGGSGAEKVSNSWAAEWTGYHSCSRNPWWRFSRARPSSPNRTFARDLVSRNCVALRSISRQISAGDCSSR